MLYYILMLIKVIIDSLAQNNAIGIGRYLFLYLLSNLEARVWFCLGHSNYYFPCHYYLKII